MDVVSARWGGWRQAHNRGQEEALRVLVGGVMSCGFRTFVRPAGYGLIQGGAQEFPLWLSNNKPDQYP